MPIFSSSTWIINISLSVPLCPSLFASGSFRSRVWQTLATEVPFGRTVSYRDLAELTGSPKAFQAVGSAMSNNPISLVVPCHRVVKADGKTGNYSKATKNDVKIWLLDHESSRKNC